MKAAKFTYIAPEHLPFYTNMDNEIQELSEMTELEACEFYKVDSKEEAIDFICEHWMSEAKHYSNNIQ